MTAPRNSKKAANPGKPEVSVRPAIDWEAIEAAYRAGVLSAREIGTLHKVSHTIINRKAKASHWVRDLSAKIKAKADALVSKQGVSSLVSVETENQTVEANAALQASVRISHRKDIGRTRDLFRNLLGELEVSSADPGAIAEAFEMLNDPSGEQSTDAQKRRIEKAREALDKVLSLPGRVDSGKRLTEMLEKLVRLEREAYGIDTDEGGNGGEKSFTEAMLNARARAAA